MSFWRQTKSYKLNFFHTNTWKESGRVSYYLEIKMLQFVAYMSYGMIE